MIRTQQGWRQPVVQNVVPEPDSPEAARPDVGVHRNLPQHHNQLQVAQQLQFAVQKASAGPQLLGQRLIVRRSAVGRGCNPDVPQFQSIVGRQALRLRREARPMQSPEKEVAGTVAGKHTSSTISAMRARSEAQNEQPG